MWIATAAEMREIERRAEAEFYRTPDRLMESAGEAVFEVVRAMASPSGRIAVVCGKGNNGGDGLVVARLAHDDGLTVALILAEGEDSLGELPREKLQWARDVGVQVVSKWQDVLVNVDWDAIVDAVLGTGARGTIAGHLREAIVAMNSSGSPIVSVDIPSGIECDTGRALGTAVMAARTVTLGLPKPFLFLESGPECAGQWSVGDIGLPADSVKPTGAWFGPKDFAWPERNKSANKGDNGHVLIVAGSTKYRGAATLAAKGALGAGAGLVTVAAIEPVVTAVAEQVPEAIFLPLPETDGVVDPSGADLVLTQQERFDACVVGPGLTTAPQVKAFLARLWKSWTKPSVVDADALNLVAQGLELPKGLNVLTPHPGEAGRLLGTDAKTVQCDRFGSARALVDKYGWPVVLKGAYTVCALKDAPLIVNSTGNPGMATGGMGDVLAGVIGTLLAQGHGAPAYAGAKGAYWHGLAGDLAAQEIGKIGFTASDLAHFLPRARSILTT